MITIPKVALIAIVVAIWLIGYVTGVLVGVSNEKKVFANKCIEVGVGQLQIPTPTSRSVEFVFITTNGLVKYP